MWGVGCIDGWRFLLELKNNFGILTFDLELRR